MLKPISPKELTFLSLAETVIAETIDTPDRMVSLVIIDTDMGSKHIIKDVFSEDIGEALMKHSASIKRVMEYSSYPDEVEVYILDSGTLFRVDSVYRGRDVYYVEVLDPTRWEVA